MSVDAAWRKALSLAAHPPIWLDDTGYCARLLAAGQVSWLNAPQLIDWRRRAHALLRPDIVALDLSPLLAAWIASSVSPQEKLRLSNRRVTMPPRVVLADDGLRAHVAEVVGGLRHCFVEPFAMVLPSPDRVVDLVMEGMPGDRPDPTDDEVETVAVYVADFLRVLGDSGLDVLLLQESRGRNGSCRPDGCYQPIINLARHYRWDVGLRAPNLATVGNCFDFVIGAGATLGIELDANFWLEGTLPVVPRGCFLYAEVPSAAVPEDVLERLGRIR